MLSFAGLKLALTLRYYATGHTYSSMKFPWRTPHNYMSLIVREVSEAIFEEYKDECFTCPTTPAGWQAIADQFYQKWNFPNTIGAMDGKHVAIKCPSRSGTLYHNYKHFFSVILFALVDADYKFIWADIGGRGAASDAQVYNHSELLQHIEDGTLGLPAPRPLPGDDKPVPFYIVGDDAFALKEHLMKPYSNRGLTKEERIFNYRLSRARRVSENAFGILAQRWQVFLTTMQTTPETVRMVLRATCVLHNLLRMRHPNLQNPNLDQERADHNIVPGAWRDHVNLLELQRARGGRVAARANAQRDLIKLWCNSDVGSVPWQEEMLNR